MKVIFPNSKSLQPMPPGVIANVSGNVNSTPTTRQQAVDSSATTIQQVNPVPLTVQTTSSYSLVWLWVIVVGILVMGLLIFWLFYRRAGNDTMNK